MENNKIVLNTGEVLLDLTADTATAEDVAAGETFHLASGEMATGTATSVLVYNNAGAHNSIYRGKNLGTAVTDAQFAAIAAGTFEGLYIGDYWVINKVTWRIAAFDYYLKSGDNECTTHHVTIVPDSPLYTGSMNDTATTAGAYISSKMYTEGLEEAKTTIKAAFGEAHILTHRLYLANAVNSNGLPSARSWYDSSVELMTEQNVYGCKIMGSTGVASNYEVDKVQDRKSVV